MISINFPSTLPQPSVVSQQPSERRLLSSITEGLPQARDLQRDFSGDEALQWKLTEAEMQIFMVFWRSALLEGGRWFNATWPRVFTARTICRFKDPPRVVLQGHQWWEVTVNSELRGLSLPPLRSSMELGMHFDDDITDVSGNNPSFVQLLGGTLNPTFTPAHFSDGLLMASLNNPIITRPRSLVLNEFGEWQVSVFVKASYYAPFFQGGGCIFELLAWGFPGGAAMGDSTSNPPPATSGQLRVMLEGDASTLGVTIEYPAFHTDISGYALNQLLDVTGAAAGAPRVPLDGATHHIGVAGDATSTRAYFDGVLVADDGNYNMGNGPLRAAGSRPMWNGTAYTEQAFLVGGRFAGVVTNYDDFPRTVVIGEFFNGVIDDLVVTRGVGSVTFIGPTITVPAAPFVR